LQDGHPLRDLIEPEHILPSFAFCFKKRKTKFKYALRTTLMKEMDLEIPEGEDAV